MTIIHRERTQQIKLLTDKDNNDDINSNKNLNKKEIKKNKNETMPMLCDNYIVKKIVKKQFEHEDFIEILRSVGLCLEQYEKLSKVKTFNKFSEIIEMLSNLVKEKENLINIIKKKNLYINSENFKLNQENIKLNNPIRKLKNVIKNNLNNFNDTLDNEKY